MNCLKPGQRGLVVLLNGQLDSVNSVSTVIFHDYFWKYNIMLILSVFL